MSCNTGTQLIGGGYSNNDGGGSYGWVSTPLFAGDSVVNSFWTHLALQDEYFATSGSSGTTLTAYALCAESTNPSGNQCAVPKMKINFTRNDNAPNAITL